MARDGGQEVSRHIGRLYEFPGDKAHVVAANFNENMDPDE